MARFVREYGLPAYDANLLTQTRGLADYFEAVARASGNAKAASNWIMGELLRTMKERGIGARAGAADAGGPRRADSAGGAAERSAARSRRMCSRECIESGRPADDIVRAEGLAQTAMPTRC